MEPLKPSQLVLGKNGVQPEQDCLSVTDKSLENMSTSLKFREKSCIRCLFFLNIIEQFSKFFVFFMMLLDLSWFNIFTPVKISKLGSQI